MFQIFRTATVLFLLLTIVTGVAYPVAVTVFAQIAFPREANGSLFPKASERSNNIRDWQANQSHLTSRAGSEWVGQSFSDPKYFWGRPSSTAPVAFNGMGGSGSNMAPTNPALVTAVQERIEKLRKEDPETKSPVPVDLVTASGSGLDPHISHAAALYQVSRVARVRKLDSFSVEKLVASHLERPTLGIFGQARVNVLKLNLALDAASPAAAVDVTPEPQ